ncbi:MAG: ATP-binding cassette domain-containing protein, partial [Pseudomonadales bacterium]|nr:ATP-binding cassette domain-containing protein [Pseudomonadales bacterium]
MALLEVSDLHVEFEVHGGWVQAVRGASFNVNEGETLAIVGESGCGKTVSVQSIMGLIQSPPGRITRGTATLRGQNILGGQTADGREIRGVDIAMIFQDPMSSLNPTMTIGAQIAEPLIVHRGYSYR